MIKPFLVGSVCYWPDLTRQSGSLAGGIFLSCALKLRPQNPDDWIAVPDFDWVAYTGIPQDELNTIRRDLERQGLISIAATENPNVVPIKLNFQSTVP